MKRTPLARKTPLVAKTRLTSSTGPAPSDGLSARVPLQRGSGLSRGAGPSRKPSQDARAAAQEWALVREEAWEGWGRCCAVGGEALTWEACHGHHRLLKSAGGPNTVENCLPVCLVHHGYIHGLGDAAYDAGWLVRAWLLPQDVPVLHDPRQV